MKTIDIPELIYILFWLLLGFLVGYPWYQIHKYRIDDKYLLIRKANGWPTGAITCNEDGDPVLVTEK